MNNTLLLNLTIHRLTFLKTTEKLLLSQTFTSPDDLLKLSKDDISQLIQRAIRKPVPPFWEAAEVARQDIQYIEGNEIQPLFYWDVLYPSNLREIYNPPFCLFYRGTWFDPFAEMLGIVGTRYPSGSGKKAAFSLAFECGRVGDGVVSGLAKGIDGEAHAGALAGKAYTCAVLGSGIDTIYPKENRKLAADILKKGGAILSEYPPGTPPLRYNFPERNRIISGLSRGVVIIEAPKKSGALITADFALEQGRDVFIHSESLASEKWEGSQNLFRDGALCISNMEDILADWGRLIPEKSGENISEDVEDTRISGILSKFLEEELTGEVLFHNGEYIRR